MGSDRCSCSSERGGQVLKGGRAKGAIREWCGVSAAATQMGKKYEMTLWSLLLLSFFLSLFLSFLGNNTFVLLLLLLLLLLPFSYPRRSFWSTTYNDLLEQFVR